jgi:hypothetical protein
MEMGQQVAGQSRYRICGVYNSELLSFWTFSIVRYSKNSRKATFQKLDLFPSSGEWGDTYSVGPLRKS